MKRFIRSPKVIIVIIFVAWSVLFIMGSSFIAMDGHRYFSLFDDAMISMRYAWNLAHGDGLVWNIGERVEGYTNFLMVLIMVPFNALISMKRYTSLSIQVVGIFTLLGIAKFGTRVLQQLGHSSGADNRVWLESLFLIGVLFYYPLTYWTLMGMETGLLAFLLVTGITYAFNARDEQGPRDLLIMTILFGLAYLTRPDSLLFSGLTFGLLFVDSFTRKLGRPWGLWILISLFILALFPAGQLIFRWAYYGELVPNTYLLKIQGFPWNLRIQNGLAFIRPLISEISIISIFALAGLILDYSWKRLVIISLFLASIAYQVWIGGDAWRMWRFSAPIFPLVLAIALLEIARIANVFRIIVNDPDHKRMLFQNPVWETPWIEKMREKKIVFVTSLLLSVLLIIIAVGVDLVGLSDSGFGEEQRILLIVAIIVFFQAIATAVRKTTRENGYDTTRRRLILGLFALAFLNANWRFLPGLTFRSAPLLVDDNLLNVNRAIAINELTDEDATIGVTAAGVLPYFSNRQAADFLGKMDKYIASLPADVSGGVAYGSMLAWPGHNKYDLEYSLLDLQPTYAQHLKWGSQNLSEAASTLYLSIEYKGILLHLLRNSPSVHWEKLQ